MKTIQSFFTAFFAIMLLASFNANAQSTRDTMYEKAMTNALTQLDSARNAAQLQQCKNQFERIAQKYSGEWLPLYYAAYCGVNSAFFDMNSAQNQALLAEAEERIEKLYAFSQADLSEINTLQAYLYTAMIALNPQVNGQKYFGKVIGLYERAMNENPKNPRPVVLLADFESHLPDFIKSNKRKPEEERAKAHALFEKEQPNIEKPYWGKFFLNRREE